MDEGPQVEAQVKVEKPKVEKEDKGVKKLLAEVRRSTPDKIAQSWDIAKRLGDLRYDPRTYEVANRVFEAGFFAAAVVSMFSNPDIPASFTMNAPGMVNATFGRFDISPNVPLPAKSFFDTVDLVIPNAGMVGRALEMAPDLRAKGKSIIKAVKGRIIDERNDYQFDKKVAPAMQTFGVESPQLTTA